MISQIDVYRQINRRNIFQFCNYWECFSFNNNRRHVYNLNDYLHVEQIKNRIAQFFSHIYKRRTYDFVVINVVKSEMIDKSNYWNEIMNSIFALFVYKLQNKQIVYNFLAINDDILYLIETFYEFDWQKKYEILVEMQLKCDLLVKMKKIFHSWRLIEKIIVKKIFFWYSKKSFTSSNFCKHFVTSLIFE